MTLKVKYPRKKEREIVRFSLNKYNLRNVKRYFTTKRWMLMRLINDGDRFSRLRFTIKKRLRHYYGNMKEKQFHKYYKMAFLSKKINNPGQIFLSILERRLGTLITRMHFSSGVFHSHQLINHGHVLVNKKKIKNGNYVVSQHRYVHIHPKFMVLLGEFIYAYLKMKIIKKNMSFNKKKIMYPLSLEQNGVMDNYTKDYDLKEFVHLYHNNVPQNFNSNFEIKNSHMNLKNIHNNNDLYEYINNIYDHKKSFNTLDIYVKNHHNESYLMNNVLIDLNEYISLLLSNHMIPGYSKKELYDNIEFIILLLLKNQINYKNINTYLNEFFHNFSLKKNNLTTWFMWRYLFLLKKIKLMPYSNVDNNFLIFKLLQDCGWLSLNMSHNLIKNHNMSLNKDELLDNYKIEMNYFLKPQYKDEESNLYNINDNMSNNHKFMKYMKLNHKKIKGLLTHLILPNYLMVSYKSMSGTCIQNALGGNIPYSTPLYLDSNLYLHLYENKRFK